MISHLPIPENEDERIIELSELDLDYSQKQKALLDLTKLASKVAGTSISLINLIDTYTQWTISNYGIAIDQMNREDSVCQYTISSESSFEVKDLTKDERFSKKPYVTGIESLRYYYGIPLQTSQGRNLGALCVLDREEKDISPEKGELLKIIADEIVNRLTAYRMIQILKSRVHDLSEEKKRVAHDIRGPLGGIISIAEIIAAQKDENKLEEILSLMDMVHKSGRSLLELADEILSNHGSDPLEERDQFTLGLFKEKLEKLYQPQAHAKNISYTVSITHGEEERSIRKEKLLQIAGNLISNAIKFTPPHGSVTVELSISIKDLKSVLQIRVSDTGPGLNPLEIKEIFKGVSNSQEGSTGEMGYGFGLPLVKHLVASLHGEFSVHAQPPSGACFDVLVPMGASRDGPVMT